MKLLFSGKTKDVFELENGNYMLKFKDDATGTDGVFDPGANTVGLSITGLGCVGLKISDYFFRIISDAGYPTHFISADIENAEMIVRPVETFGNGVEVICRYRAVGSFLRRYGMYVSDSQKLDGLVEFTLKDDGRNDPPVTRDTLLMLGIMSGHEYDKVKELARGISDIIKQTLCEKGLELYDIKLEFGRCEGAIVLIDEISGGNMRVYKDNEIVAPLDLPHHLF